MEYALAVFRARTETVTFSNLLKSYGVSVMIISTPRQINVSCGISVRFNRSSLEQARSIISRRRFNTFAGFYYVQQVGSNLRVTPLN